MGKDERLEKELHLQIQLFFRKMKTYRNIVKCRGCKLNEDKESSGKPIMVIMR